MRRYHLYVRNKKQYEVVPIGFSWGVLVLGPIWCLIHGQLLRYLGVIVASITPALFALLLDQPVRNNLILFAVVGSSIGHIYFCVMVNSWKERSLLSKGYSLVAAISGRTSKSALEDWSKSDNAIKFLGDAT